MYINLDMDTTTQQQDQVSVWVLSWLFQQIAFGTWARHWNWYDRGTDIDIHTDMGTDIEVEIDNLTTQKAETINFEKFEIVNFWKC